MAIISPQAQALVHLARKRRLLDAGGCARLRILLGDERVVTAADARRFLASAMVPPTVAAVLTQVLPTTPRLGPYQVLAHLADGGMGSVWLATRSDDDDRRATPSLDRPAVGELVVAKSLHARFAATEEARLRFDREARLMAELRHPHVVAIRDLDVTQDGLPFLVMDFVDSGDLKDLVETQGPLSESLALAIAHQIAEAIAAAQARGIIHRDVKPANIFVRPDGWATLADFGLARSTAAGSTVLTMEGAQIGSPLYMSPEQIRAQGDVDVRSDLYALGCVLYFCLVGSPPYGGTSVQEVQHRHLTAPVPDVAARRAGLGRATAAVVTRLLSKERQQRYATAEDTARALREALCASGLTATMPEAYVVAPSPVLQARGDLPPAPAARAQNSIDPLSLLTTTGDEGPPPTIDTRIAAKSPSAGVASPVVATPSRIALSIDQVSSGMEQSWIALLGESTRILLYARLELTLGKLCEPPVDICLRKYPVERFRDDCLRIGRNHLRLRFDPVAGRMEMIDQGSTHGTTVDGVRLTANTPTPLAVGRLLPVLVAGSLSLACQVHRSGNGAATPAYSSLPNSSLPGCGIDQPHALDACVLTRPDNHPGMSYAMVLRRLTIGGPGAHLQLPGARSMIEIALFAGRWIWRSEPTAPWSPLRSDQDLVLDGQRLRAVSGNYDQFIALG